jgi:hypothetical protein
MPDRGGPDIKRVHPSQNSRLPQGQIQGPVRPPVRQPVNPRVAPGYVPPPKVQLQPPSGPPRWSPNILTNQRPAPHSPYARIPPRPITPKISTPSPIRTAPGVRLPNLPRNPFLNARWPKWARIPPKLRLPTAYLTGAGLGMLRPTLPDLLFGYIPDAMEASRPWVYKQLGIEVPGDGKEWRGQPGIFYTYSWSNTASKDGITPIYNPGASVILEGPVGVHESEIRNDGYRWYYIYSKGGQVKTDFGYLPTNYQNTMHWVKVTPLSNPDAEEQPYSLGGIPGVALNPLDLLPGFNRGNQPSTPIAPGIPANQPGARPATDPRGYRRDLSPTSPGVSSTPTPQPDPTTPKPDPNATSCRFNPTDQAGIDALKNRIQNLEQENRRLQEALQSANQATYYSVPYVVEDASGKRVKQNYGLSLKGLVDTSAVFALSNQTADWALQQGQNATTQRIYQILGGDSMWGNKPQPEHETNPDEALRQTPVIDFAGVSQNLKFSNLPDLFRGQQAAAYQRQGLQRFPLTAQAPSLTSQGLLDDTNQPKIFRDSTDVQVTTSDRGWAVIKGVNEVIRRSKQTIEWLRIDRMLNILNFATTLHNALMLSNALGQTLIGIIDNILATFGFALKDANGNTIGVGDLIGGTIENLIKAAIGADNYTNLKKDWAKANRIYQSAMNIVYSVQSIGYSILGALEIVGKWLAWIGNALKRFGAITEKAYPWMNPTPNFQNQIFTKIEAAQELAEALEVVTAEARSVTETVTELGNQKKALDKALEDGKDKPGVPDNKEQKEEQDKRLAASQAPIIPKFDLVRPEPENN